MALVKEIEDKGAVLAWSPVAAHPSMAAIGTKESGGQGFDDFGGHLEIHRLNFAEKSLKCSMAGSVKTSGRFESIAWSGMASRQSDFSLGLIAGGMTDGTINVWDPAKLVTAHPESQLSTFQHHNGAVNGLEFNPHPQSQHLLASGSSDSKVLIHQLDRPETPKQPFVPAPEPNTANHTAEVTTVAWNPVVAHILASASQNGSCMVWDLRSKKPWCELRDPARACIADIAWNPVEGLHMMTAIGDDANPVIKMWDLRSSTTLPLATLQGHTQGLLSVSWCSADTSLLMSCGKDNRSFLWDLASQDCKPVYELPATADVNPANGGFGGFGSAIGRRYQTKWSPRLKGVLATCSFDRKVQVFNMSAVKTTTARGPSWMRRPAGASFGFGGKLVSFKGMSQKPGQRTPQMVTLCNVVSDSQLVDASNTFEQSIAQKNYKGLCEAKSELAVEGQVWKFMSLIFEENSRSHLLDKLGFNAAEIEASMNKALEASKAEAEEKQVEGEDMSQTTETTAENFFKVDKDDGGSAVGSSVSGLAADDEAESATTATTTTSVAEPVAVHKEVKKEEEDDSIKKALLVGNFRAAVNGCFDRGQFADALLLASCDGAELWEQTRMRYFELESKSRPYLKIVSAIITCKLDELVHSSDLGVWRETLAILSTYAKSDDFPRLCEQLASRLEVEMSDKESASLCYMCAANIPKTVEYWISQFEKSSLGGRNSMALEALVEKVTVFTQEDPGMLQGALEPMISLLTEYGALLANQGATMTALKYIRGNDQSSNELRHRLFYAACMESTNSQHPPTPFAIRRVGVSPNFGQTLAQIQQAQASQQAAQQQAAEQQAQAQQLQAQQAAAAQAQPAAAAAPADAGLPSGWIWQNDPASGMVFYVNTMTGHTQWDKPIAAPQPHAAPSPAVPQPMATAHQQQQPAALSVQPSGPGSGNTSKSPSPYNMQPGVQPTQQHQQPQSMQQPQQVQPHQQPQPTPLTQPITAVVPKQDGFVSKQSQPRTGNLAYTIPGNTPSADALAGAAPTAAAVTTGMASMDVSGLSGDVKPIMVALNDIVARISAVPLNPPEKKQLGEVNKAVNALLTKLNTAGMVAEDVSQKALSLATAAQTGDYATALSVHKDLCNTQWDKHKDWIKGLKNLIGLAQRKIRY